MRGQPPPARLVRRTLTIPNSTFWLGVVGGLISQIAFQSEWDDAPTFSAEQSAEVGKDILLSFYRGSGLVGTLMPYVGELPPLMLKADGQTYAKSDYPLLWEYLPDGYKTPATFNVPNLTGRFILGADALIPAREPGAVGGAARVTLDVDEMPGHSHTSPPHTHGIFTAAGVNEISPGAPVTVTFPSPVPLDVTEASIVSINTAGGGQSHENMPPYAAFFWGIICE